MHITTEQLDDLNALVKIAIHKEDYKDKVEKTLKDYRKQANIPGFRKGQVPLGLIQKQYGKAVLIDEVNKLLQRNLSKHLSEEKLDVLGRPLPKLQDNFDWNSEVLDFEFELGLAPSFEVKVKSKKAIIHYTIVADKKTVDEQVKNLQRQYGIVTPKEAVGKSDEVTGTFTHEAEDINHKTTLEVDKLHKKAREPLVGKQVGESVLLSTKTLFKDDGLLVRHLGISREKAENLKLEVTFALEAINEREPAALNQELFDKVYDEGQVTSEKALREHLKEDYESQFKQFSDQKLLNDFTEKLIEETTFNLPAVFLQKWMQHSGEEPLSEEEAKEAFEKSEKGIRYQLIQEQLIQEHNLQVQLDELKAFTKTFLTSQMAQFGRLNPEEEELNAITDRVLANQDEVKRLSDRLMNEKLLTLCKEKANLKTKEVTYEAFVKEAYR